jgi:hypothetical protein
MLYGDHATFGTASEGHGEQQAQEDHKDGERVQK